MAERSILQLAPMHRLGVNAGEYTKQERRTYDFVVDGESLAQLLEVEGRDLVGRLDCGHGSVNDISARVLIGDAPADVDGNRVMLFVCPECGALGCGAITAAFEASGETVIWSDFRHENSYDESMTTRYPGVGPFHFAADAYRQLLKSTK